jgi:hypothetical protein
MFMIQEDAKVVVRVIPHERQRYPTVGDWFYSGGVLYILVSDMGNEDYHTLVATHEYVEAILCQKAGISEISVTEFDLEFERRREKGEVPEFAEPGNDSQAPYYNQHQFATQIEKILSVKLGVNWEEYDAAVNAL